MHSSTAGPVASDEARSLDPDLAHLERVIEEAAHLLPAQGPINVFIHHNTLHAFEDLPFNEAVKKASHVFGCQPYLSEDRYRQELLRGRIRFAELREALEQDLGDRASEEIPCFGSRLELRLAMLQFPLRVGPTEELVWYVAEADALAKVREEISAADRARLIAETRRWVVRDLRGHVDDVRNGSVGVETPSSSLAELLLRFDESRMETWSDEDWERFTLQALWRVCCDGVRGLPAFTPPPSEPIRHRDLLHEATGADADLLVHEHLARFCAAFLDQGMAYWQLPDRGEGFLRSYCSLYRRRLGPPDRWLRGLSAALERIDRERTSPLELIRESLSELGVPHEDRGEFLSSTLLALRGWAGMVHQVETRGDRVLHPAPSGSLVEFLAVRLLLDRFALAYAAKDVMGYRGPLAAVREECRRRIERPWPPRLEQRAFLVFQLAQLKGLSPDVLYHRSRPEWRTMLEEIESFTGVDRRRVFHLAYERRLYTQAADALALNARRVKPSPSAPRFQAIFCIDEREESFRRHLEELAPDVSTYGTAGFFSVPMYYRGLDDAYFVPLCPVVVRPRNWVAEQVVEGQQRVHLLREQVRRAMGKALHRFSVGSRSLTLGAFLSAVIGVPASIPLVARTLFPHLTSRFSRKLGRFVRTLPATRLDLEREGEEAGPEAGQRGFTILEMTEVGEKVLREIGLTSGFSRLVLVLGHGSSSLNNPHASAYDCGACGGASGGPNARALAQMLNKLHVRDQLRNRGLRIPTDTYFLAGMHNTSRDSVSFQDLHLLPESHRTDFDHAAAILDAACDRNAHERCRRFESAPLSISRLAARKHVEARGEDLAQVRPELGHATNALCFVGRRDKTRGLFLDRRAFLCSYDPTQDDPECSILTRILKAVVPVAAGINLEYYFSFVDNLGYGAGSKLPHNVAALLGVMDGAASDLRTGLPWQMVEIHEPVRILFIVEATPGSMLRLLDAEEGIGKLCRNRWLRLAVMDPETSALSVFQGGEFRPYTPQSGILPRARTSVDWYQGWRDHLEFAQIGD